MKLNTYDRHTLYQQVWQRPMGTVAAQYGISDVMLKKICKRLNVPTPQRGYWAKVAAGKTPPVPRLPQPKQHASTQGWGMDAQDVEAAAARHTDYLLALDDNARDLVYGAAREIEYAPRIRLRPLLKEMRETGGCPGAVRRVNYPQNYTFDTWVSAEQTPRVTAMLEALARAAEKLGGELTGALTLHLLGEKVELIIKERAIKQEHELTSHERAALEKYEREKKLSSWAYKPSIRKWEFRFTGKLELYVVSGDSFVDSDSIRLEERLPEVFVSMCRAAMHERAKRFEVDKRRGEHEEAVARAQEAVDRYNAEAKKLGEAIEQAKRLKLANDLRSYALALRGLGLDEMTEYACWVNDKADWIDPLVEKGDAVFGGFAGEIPPAPKRDVSSSLPWDIERYYRQHGMRPDQTWERFCEMAVKH